MIAAVADGMIPSMNGHRPPVATPHEPRLARVASHVADPARARMLSYLLSGDCASAGELAAAASVSAATASAHLARLLDAGLLAVQPRGRHRYFRIADAEVAHALEALALVAERGAHERAWASPQRQRLRLARSCYRHLAGRLGVALFEAMGERGWLANAAGGGFALTDEGRCGLRALGFDAAVDAAVVGARSRVAYACMDWSERRDHLAGSLATAMLDRLLERHWLRRRPGERALELTPEGRAGLAPLVGRIEQAHVG